MSVKTKAGKTTKVPKFKSEAEEAEWWDRTPDFIADRFEKAAKEGLIPRGLPGRGATRSVTIRLAMKDVETAQTLAAKMGLPYTASSSRPRRPISIAWRTNACWSGVSSCVDVAASPLSKTRSSNGTSAYPAGRLRPGRNLVLGR
jgi:predicted DNA binding CopG/RHH family protein